MRVYCHGTNCDNLIRNDEQLGDRDLEPGTRTHIKVKGVPFCMECHEMGPMGNPLVCGVPVDEEDITTVLGGQPTQYKENKEAK